MLLFFPMLAPAQSNEALQQQHRSADQQLQQLYPGLKKINLDSLQQAQARENNKCSTCPNRHKTATKTVEARTETLESLQNNEQRILKLIADLSNNDEQADLVQQKYEQALHVTRVKIVRLKNSAQQSAKKASKN
jgi:ElaB/YqjD/DUF883 family membrane-anchored ribosome-binding protein